MIWDSQPWRTELQKYATNLESFSNSPLTEDTEWDLEYSVMVGCFIARKLIETPFKVPDSVIADRFHFPAYPAVANSGIHAMNWHHLDRYFDFETPRSRTLGTKKLCDQVIHSFVLCPVVDDSNTFCEAVLIASDRDKGALLYEIGLSTLATVFRRVAENEVAGLSYTVVDSEIQRGTVRGSLDDDF